MRRFVTAGALALFVALFTGCDQETQTPTEPQFGKQKPADCDLDGTTAGAIRAGIDDLFSNKKKKKAAVEIFSNIERKVCKGQYADATNMAYDFYVMTYGQLPDKLNGDESDAATLVSMVFAFAADPSGPGAPVIPPEALLPTGGVGVIIPETPDTIWTNNDEAAFVVDAGSFVGTGPVTVVLTRLSDPVAPNFPIPGYQAYPEAYDFSASAELTGFAEFWMCVVTDALPVPFENLVIGHDLGDGESEILTPPLYEDVPGQIIDCSGASYQPVIVGSAGTPGWLQLAGTVLEPVMNRLLDVKPLHAMYFAGKGLGGRGGSLSPFAPVDTGEPYQFSLTCTASPYGGVSWGSGGCSFVLTPGGPTSGTSLGVFDSGTLVDVTISPAAGYQIASVTGCTTGDGTTGSCSVLMTADRNITAVFEPIPTTDTYVLTLGGAGGGSGSVEVSYTSPGGGGVTETCVYPLAGGAPCTFTVPGNVQIMLAATPGAGTTFDGWGDECAAAGGSSCWLIMYENRTVSADFTQDVVILGSALTITITDEGRAGASTVVTDNHGQSCLIGDSPCTFDYPGPETAVTITGTPDEQGPASSFVAISGACTWDPTGQGWGAGSCSFTAFGGTDYDVAAHFTIVN